MTRARLAGVVAVLALSAATARAQQFQVKAGVNVSPDTVKVGDPFRVTVGIRAPRGATIEFPRATDSASTVQSLDPVAVRTSSDTTATERYADYRVAAWDVGQQAIRLADAIVRYNGVERRVPLSGAVFVQSVLPADSAQRVPKPPRALFELNPFPWWLIALLIAAAIITGWLIWWWFRRRRKKATPVIVDPFAHAKSEFQRIEALGLLDAGERGRYVALMVDVVRDYLAARHAQAALSLTSTELERTVRALPTVPEDRLTRVLTEADLIKFARRPVSTDRAREIGREARTIVAEEHKASRPAPAPEKAGQEVAA
jgi:hypothetical protein